MMQASYVIWGSALATLFTLVIASWTIRWIRGRKHIAQENGAGHDASHCSFNHFETQHQALMLMMNQKTDSVLAALARTIEQERQKLGMVVRNPSIIEMNDTSQGQIRPISEPPRVSYEQVLPMAGDGMDTPTIARRLNMSEAEVSMVMRLKTA